MREYIHAFSQDLHCQTCFGKNVPLVLYVSELDHISTFKKRKKIINFPKRNKETCKHWVNKILKCWSSFKYLNYNDHSCAWTFITEVRWKIRNFIDILWFKRRKVMKLNHHWKVNKGTAKWNGWKNKYVLRPQENIWKMRLAPSSQSSLSPV